jgi:glycosyltransferase involved in cell wall biosynthesis
VRYECIVLLSTYNGEKYISELLDSLKKQTIPFKIYWRDDGSSDETTSILTRYRKELNLYELPLSGVHLGVKNSYRELLKAAYKENLPIAFCDQDDMWAFNKLEIQTNCIKQGIELVFSKVHAFDREKSRIFPREWNTAKESAIFQNQMIGCTAMMSPKLGRDISKLNWDKALEHDSFIYLFALLKESTIARLDSCLVSYRIHESNNIGINFSFAKKFKLLINFPEKKLAFFEQFLSVHSQTKSTYLQHLTTIESQNFIQRYKTVQNLRFRQSRIENLILKSWMVFSPRKLQLPRPSPPLT